MILITGTTGLVGTHLLARLLEQNNPKHIRGLYRTDKKLSFCLNVIKRVYGDDVHHLAKQVNWFKSTITDLPTLEKSFDKVKHVYHCAGLISNSPSERNLLRKINIEGTANVVNLAIDYKVEKLCHVSSIATLGNNKEQGIVDEDAYRENLNNSSFYSIAKYGGEMEAWRASQEGLDVIIVNPGIILGEGFYESGSGEIVKQAAKNFPFKIEKTTGFIGVKDVVEAMLILMSSKIKNQRFILIERNMKINEVQNLLANKLGKKQPSIKLRKWMLYVYWIFDVVYSFVTRKKRKISFDVIPTLLQDKIYTNEKIKNKISLEFRPIDKVIESCCQDYRKIN